MNFNVKPHCLFVCLTTVITSHTFDAENDI